MKSFSNLKNKATLAVSGQASQPLDQHDDQSLTSMLSREQRAELSLLISQTLEEMRSALVKVFDYKSPSSAPQEAASEKNTETIDLSTLTLNEPDIASGADDRVEDLAASRDEPADGSKDETAHTPEVKALRSSALTFFDTWAESVVLRVGEVVNYRDPDEPAEKSSESTQLASQPAKDQFQPTPRQQNVAQQVRSIYQPVETPLAQLSHLERFTILNSVLLLLLSLEAYRSHSRTLLLRLTISLRITPAELTKMETDIAFGLLSAAAKMDASSQTTQAQEKSAMSRKWKIGVAGVAGAALIGITGGLAAPLLAAGVGGLMGGLGLGATAAAGYLGALAGNAVLVGGLFGAYGARMTSRTMDKYSKEIEDFAFLPINGSLNDGEEEQKKRRRLRLTIGVTGWLAEESQVTLPWRVFGDGGEPFALRWELKALEDLGSALRSFVMSQAWSQIKKEVIKRTILAALYSAVMAPLAIKKAIRFVDSPWGIAKDRALKAGEVLADALIHKVQGERPVSLVGQSLGARVIYSCLLALARWEAFGLVENVVIMGGAIPSDAEAWRAMRSVVSGRLVNVYSSQDYILAFLYRTSSAQLGVAGIQAIEGVSGVENIDMSEQVPGHLAYMQRTGRVLEKVGWEDLDETVVKKQEMLNNQVDEDAKKDEEKGEASEEGVTKVEEKPQLPPRNRPE